MLATSCSDVPTGSDPTVTALGRIALAPVFTPSAVQAYQQLAQIGIEVTSVRVHLVGPDGSTRDTAIAFPVGMSELEIELGVPLRTAGQTFRADLELLNSDGVVLFTGSQQVVAQVTNGVTGNAPATVQISYTGPGAAAKTVLVSPPSGPILGGATISVSASALDANGVRLPNLLVRWTTSDASIATITPLAQSTATLVSTGKRGVVTISAITPLGLTGTATLTVVPTAAKIVVISGGGQIAVAGSMLPQPLVVELQATDNLPVANAPLSFRAITAGGEVTSVGAISDANGRASTTFTLGQLAGVYQYEASSGAAVPATVSATATAAPATNIGFQSGNGQSAVVNTTLPQPLVVRVTNKFGAPVAGVVVNWNSTTRGTVGSVTSTTGADGTASTTFKLGTQATFETVRASLTGVATSTSEVYFSIEALADVPASITGTGGGQHAPAGTALPNPLIVRLTDQYGNQVAKHNVVWTVASGSTATATLSPPTSSTDGDGRASTQVTLGNIVGPLTITATAGPVTFNFNANADLSSAPTSPGSLSGFVFDAVSGSPLAGASVTILSGSQTVATTTTGGNGNFTTVQLPAGSYTATITAQGYTTVTIFALAVNGNTQAPAAPLVPQSTQSGGISGVVYNATNNQPVGTSVTLELRAGVSSTTGTPLQTVTSTQSSYAFTNVAAGTYTVVAKATGFADATKTGISVGGSTTSNQDIFVSPVGAAGNVRIVLSWRASPRDLDSYLTGPDGAGGRFLVAYYSQGNCSAAPFACLDNDVTGGNGPETVTITRQLTGVYRFSVNNYSRSPDLSVSGARVDVYIDNALAQSFSVPSGSGLNWTVFELNGRVITPINVIGGQSPAVARIGTGGGVSASRIPTSAGSRDDNAKITEGSRTHPKRSGSPR